MSIDDPDFLNKFTQQFTPAQQGQVIDAVQLRSKFGADAVLAASIVFMVNHDCLAEFVDEVTEYLLTQQTKRQGFSEN